MTFGPANTRSSYLPIEYNLPQDQTAWAESIAERNRLIANVINVKENGNYELQELLSAQQWFSTQAANQPQIARYGFRTTVDLVALNGGVPIPNGGPTILTLTSSTVPRAIQGGTIPLPSHGSATTSTGVWIFLNDPRVYVQFTPSTNQIVIFNFVGTTLTQCYFVIEYLKQ